MYCIISRPGIQYKWWRVKGQFSSKEDAISYMKENYSCKVELKVVTETEFQNGEIK